jgi:hypothetical protein
MKFYFILFLVGACVTLDVLWIKTFFTLLVSMLDNRG